MITRGQSGFKAHVLFLFASLIISQFAFAGQEGAYPQGPNEQLTPGELCAHPDSFRYKEKIPYCSRDVETELKWEIIDTYDKSLGYHIRETGRGDFKIDHYIPLCMGGSNEKENLWPQHKSVYKITDPMEQIACEKMAQGRLKQKDAVEMIRRGKNDLSQVSAILQHLKSL